MPVVAVQALQLLVIKKKVFYGDFEKNNDNLIFA